MIGDDTTRHLRGRAARVALKRLGVIASVALNVGFLSTVLARSSFQVEAPVALSRATIHAPSSTAPAGYKGYKEYFETLLARGLSDTEAKTLLLARLEARARELAVEPPPPYWQRDTGSALASALRLSAELDHARAALVEAFGAEAEREPTFARLFRPLDPVFSFISSAQQIAIQRHKLEQQVALADAVQRAPVAEPLSRAPSNATAAANKFAESLGTMLEPTAFHEYSLRDSPLAEQLRRSGVEFTEAEFRETFDILRRLERSIPDTGSYANARGELRALLGGRRFSILWASRDPLLSTVRRAGEKHSLDNEKLLSVYELFNDHQDALLEVTRSASGDLGRQSRSLREAQTRLETRLSGLVGVEVAADIERSYAQQAMSLSQEANKLNPLVKED
jgi:hypothetical protein